VATLTITTTGAQDARIVYAFGKALNLGRDATGPEVKAAVIAYITNTVRGIEARDAAEAAAAAVTPISPT
jgi:hypothetical protein